MSEKKPGYDEYGVPYFPWQGHLLLAAFVLFILYMADTPLPESGMGWAFTVFGFLALHLLAWSIIASSNKYSNNLFSLSWLRRLTQSRKP